MKRKTGWICIMILCILMPSILTAQSTDQILVVTEEWEDATNTDGTGLYFDILRAVFEKEGISVNFKIVPYARSTVLIQKGQADVMVGSYADEIEGVTYPDLFFDADDVSALFLSANSSSWGGEPGLKDTRCSYIRGYELDEYIDVPIKIFEVDDRETALKMLKAGRVDYYLDACSELESMIEDFPQYADIVSIESIKNLELYMCFQGNQRGKELAGKWDVRINEMMKSGELLAIFENWDSGEWYSELFE